MVAPTVDRTTNTPLGKTSNTPLQQRFGIGGNQDPSSIYVGDLFAGGSLGGKSFYNYDVVAQNFAMLSPKATQKIAQDAQKWAGYSSPVPQQNLPGFYEKMVQISYQAQTQYGVKISPLEAYDWWKKKTGNVYGSSSVAAGGSGGGGGGAAAPTKRVNLTDPDTAEQLVNTALETYLGRAANSQEQEVFRKALRRKEMRNPTEVDIQGDTAVSKGGVNPAVQAKDFAMAQEGSAEYRASTTLLDTFINSIKNPVGM
jgi:hypothetical protein